MIIENPPYNGKRFIGDKSTKKVHDFQKNACHVNEENAIPFDDLPQAHANKYENCQECLNGIFIGPVAGASNFKASMNTGIVTKKAPSYERKVIGGIKTK